MFAWVRKGELVMFVIVTVSENGSKWFFERESNFNIQWTVDIRRAARFTSEKKAYKVCDRLCISRERVKSYADAISSPGCATPHDGKGISE